MGKFVGSASSPTRAFALRRWGGLARGGSRRRLLASPADRGGLGPEGGGLVTSAELIEERGMVLAACCQVRMIRRQALVQDRDGALVERLGLPVAAGGLVEQGQVVEVGG